MLEVTQLLADLPPPRRPTVPQGKGLEQDWGGWCDPVGRDPQSNQNHEIKKHTFPRSTQTNDSKKSESGAPTHAHVFAFKNSQRAVVGNQSQEAHQRDILGTQWPPLCSPGAIFCVA